MNERDTRPTEETPQGEDQAQPIGAAPQVEEGARPADETQQAAEPVAAMEAPAAPKEPSRFGLFLRRALRWSAGIGVVFALGIGALWFTQVRPQAERIRELQSDLEAARSQVEALQKEVEDLRPLESENADLQASLAAAQQRHALLSTLVDVTQAQLALAQDDGLAARAALAEAPAQLKSLQRDLSGQEAETLAAMQDRLDLVLRELDQDETFAAQRDLEVLANGLVELDRALFGQ